MSSTKKPIKQLRKQMATSISEEGHFQYLSPLDSELDSQNGGECVATIRKPAASSSVYDYCNLDQLPFDEVS